MQRATQTRSNSVFHPTGEAPAGEYNVGLTWPRPEFSAAFARSMRERATASTPTFCWILIASACDLKIILGKGGNGTSKRFRRHQLPWRMAQCLRA